MRNSTVPFTHLLRVALLALPVLLLLGLHGRTVTVLRPAAPADVQLRDNPRGTVIRQRVVFEAASPLLAHYQAPAALGWLPLALPAAWPLRLLRRAVAAAPVGAPATFVAQLCRQRLLRVCLLLRAP